jgi:hypothetical protein
VLKDQKYDNVLPGQGHHTLHGIDDNSMGSGEMSNREKLPLCYFIHHKSYVKLSRIEPSSAVRSGMSCFKINSKYYCILLDIGQSSWLEIQRSWVRFPVLPDFLRSSRSGMGSIVYCH